jgi:NADPH-dependent ferric siderophore reductase
MPLRSATRIAGSVMGRFLTPAVVGAIVDHGPSLRTITLTTAKPATWTPGDKIRLAVGGLALRAYTPLQADGDALTILAHLAGTGPGSEWCARAEPGHECRMLGPQRSIELPKLDLAPLVVGDETSLGLYLAQRATAPAPADAADAADLPTGIFEVDDPDAPTEALGHHGAPPATFVTRRPGDGHLGQLAATVLDALAARPDTRLCLSGRAQTIAALRRALKDAGLARRTAVAKAYWDVNRAGLE